MSQAATSQSGDEPQEALIDGAPLKYAETNTIRRHICHEVGIDDDRFYADRSTCFQKDQIKAIVREILPDDSEITLEKETVSSLYGILADEIPEIEESETGRWGLKRLQLKPIYRELATSTGEMQ